MREGCFELITDCRPSARTFRRIKIPRIGATIPLSWNFAIIGNTIWYIVTCNNEWHGLVCFSAAALKCGARDRWIGWGIVCSTIGCIWWPNHSRFLIPPTCHYKNLASEVLFLCRRRIQKDGQDRFEFPLLMMDTFVDPSRFIGTIYHAAN